MDNAALSRFIHVMSAHQGKHSGIRGAELAKKCSVSPRDLRTLVSAARMQGVLVASIPATGYYIATNADEAQEYIEFLRARAMHSLKLVSRAKHIGLPALLGQMNLRT